MIDALARQERAGKEEPFWKCPRCKLWTVRSQHDCNRTQKKLQEIAFRKGWR